MKAALLNISSKGPINSFTFAYKNVTLRVIIPLFKTHYSIGKSILTLNSETEEDDIGPNS